MIDAMEYEFREIGAMAQVQEHFKFFSAPDEDPSYHEPDYYRGERGRVIEYMAKVAWHTISPAMRQSIHVDSDQLAQACVRLVASLMAAMMRDRVAAIRGAGLPLLQDEDWQRAVELDLDPRELQ